MRKALAWFMAIAVALTCTGVSLESAEAAYADEGGEVVSVTTAEEFAAMEADGNYRLDSDIAITSSYGNPFTGAFDGNGHTITVSTGGVFGTVDGGRVENLTVDGAFTSSSSANAGVCSTSNNASTFYRCVNKADISTTGRTGRAAGIVCNATGTANTTTITECANYGDISGSGTSCYSTGIAAYVAGTVTISKCYNTGDLTGASRTAGIVGQIGSGNSATDCYNVGALTGGTSGTGEILGWNNASAGAENCYWTGENAVQGGGSGVPVNCEKVADSAAMLEKLSSAGYVADSQNINGGYPILEWQKSAGSSEETVVDEGDQQVLDSIKSKYEAEYGALRPSYDKCSNINKMIEDKIAAYEIEGLSADKIKVEVKSSDDTDVIAEDGTINYIRADEWTMSGMYSKNVSCVFNIAYGTADFETSARTVTVGWDVEYFEGKMQEEADKLTEESIKGENADLANVESQLTLPRSMGTSAKKVWSEIEWTVSEPSVISPEQEEYTGIGTPLKGVVNRPEFDTEVTLTATFKANESILNTNVETVSDFSTITKTFTVTVKGTGIHEDTEDELRAILDKYYTDDMLQNFADKTTLDRDNCTGDIQLPRYTRIDDEDGNPVFENKEITVTSDNETVIRINGYRAFVDRFAIDKKTTVKLTVSFTRGDKTVSRDIAVTVIPVSDEELDAELATMDKAKASYWDGINDGVYKSKNEITGNLKAFQEINIDAEGNVSFIYNYNDMTNRGIIPDGWFEDSWEMEAAGYNRFKSSVDNVIAHENLVYTEPEKDTDVTITSWLTSERFGEYAPAHPENEKLQKLYKQEVSVTVKVLAPHTHQMVHHPASGATYTSAGNTEYWECTTCGKCYKDEAGTQLIDEKSTVVPKKVARPAAAGTVLKSGKSYYKVKSSSVKNPTVYFAKTSCKRYCTIPATIKVNHVTYKVTGISAKAFKGKKKFRTVIVKTKSLTKSSVKKCFSKSRVRTVKVKVGSSSLNKKYVKIYKKYFKKSNSGRKVTVRR